MLRVIGNHRRAAYDAPAEMYEGLTIKPEGLSPETTPPDLIAAARDAWDRAVELGTEHGFRNAQATVLAPTGTIGLVMDCDTTGIEPDFALVKFKKLAGGGYFKIINQGIPAALKTLGYTTEQIDDIVAYAVGHGTLEGLPDHRPREPCTPRDSTDEVIARVEKALPVSFDLGNAFAPHVIGEDFLLGLGFSNEELADWNLDVLASARIHRPRRSRRPTPGPAAR